VTAGRMPLRARTLRYGGFTGVSPAAAIARSGFCLRLRVG
jgi:hypothetical protein